MRQQYSIAQTMVPSQINNSVMNPQAGWVFDMTRDAGYQQTKVPSDQQSDNYFYYNEPATTELKDKAFGMLTGLEPVFGHMVYPLNPLNQEQTNREGRDLQMMTQQESQGAPHTQNPLRTMIGQPDMYPYLRGRKWYTIGLNGFAGQ
jgi:hypothetical protein